MPLLINDTLNKLAGVHSTVAPQGHLRRPELETKYLGSVRVTDAALCQVPGARCFVPSVRWLSPSAWSQVARTTGMRQKENILRILLRRIYLKMDLIGPIIKEKGLFIALHKSCLFAETFLTKLLFQKKLF